MVCDTREQALEAIEKELFNKSAQWSREIKMRAGFVCQKCGELDKSLLESHHIKPRDMFPAQMYDLSNGECVCLWRHAVYHRNNPVVLNMILLRLLRILTKRHCNPLSSCQMELFSEESEKKEAQGGETTYKE